MELVWRITSRAALVIGPLLVAGVAQAQTNDTPANDAPTITPPTAPTSSASSPQAAAPAPPVASTSSSAAASAAPAVAPPPNASSSASLPATPAAAPVATPPAPLAFVGDAIGNLADEASLALKLYGDTSFSARTNSENKTYASTFSNAKPNAYAPGVWGSFAAPHLDLFATADVSKLSFLAEVMFEADDNQISVDTERLQIAYVFANWLRVTAGRKHLSFGYYNDTYHHGNLFELTTARPYAVQFEDSGGLILAHNVGVALDGTFETSKAGAFRYDAEIGNGRNEDITSTALQFSEKNDKMVNVRLRWMPPIDGLILGVNGMRDVIPSHTPDAGTTAAFRPTTEELVGGAHVVYMEHDVHLDLEGFVIRHNSDGLASANILGAFLELGYSIGAFTPYVRPEWIRFPSNATTTAGDYGPGADIVYQYDQTSAYYAARDFTDLRAGVKWLVIPQLALKLEGERLAKDGTNQEIATIKAAFGF